MDFSSLPFWVRPRPGDTVTWPDGRITKYNHNHDPANGQFTSGVDVDKAVEHLQNKAHAHSTKYCARYVKNALIAGGVHHDAWPAEAKEYGPYLEKAGFKKVASQGYMPQKGDVVVIQPYEGGNPSGHIQMYDGKIWISDFKQGSSLWPGKGYAQYHPPYAIYRP